MKRIESFRQYEKVQRDYARWTWRRLDDEVIHCIPVNDRGLHWFVEIEPPRYRTRNLIRITKAAP